MMVLTQNSGNGLRGLEGQIYHVVLAKTASLGNQRPFDAEDPATNTDRLPDRIDARGIEEIVRHRVAQEGDRPSIILVSGAKPGTLRHLQVLNGLIIRSHALDLRRPVLIPEYL